MNADEIMYLFSWDVMLCQWVFGSGCVETTVLPQNAEKQSPIDAASHSRRPATTSTLLQEP
jgi:hypothetical protein